MTIYTVFYIMFYLVFGLWNTWLAAYGISRWKKAKKKGKDIGPGEGNSDQTGNDAYERNEDRGEFTDLFAFIRAGTIAAITMLGILGIAWFMGMAG